MTPSLSVSLCLSTTGVNRSLPEGVRNVSCIQEGWSSILHWNGTQHRMATFVRTDGNAETSMGLAVRSSLLPACLCACLPSSSSAPSCQNPL